MEQPGDSVDDYVERQIQMWKGAVLPGEVLPYDNFQEMMYHGHNHDKVQADPVIDPDYRSFLIDGEIDTHTVSREAEAIAADMIEQDVLLHRFNLPVNILSDPARMNVLRTELKELIEEEILDLHRYSIRTPPDSPPGSPVVRTPPGSPPLGPVVRTPPGSPSDGDGGDDGGGGGAGALVQRTFAGFGQQRRSRVQQAVSSLAGRRVTNSRVESQALGLAAPVLDGLTPRGPNSLDWSSPTHSRSDGCYPNKPHPPHRPDPP